MMLPASIDFKNSTVEDDPERRISSLELDQENISADKEDPKTNQQQYSSEGNNLEEMVEVEGMAIDMNGLEVALQSSLDSSK